MGKGGNESRSWPFGIQNFVFISLVENRNAFLPHLSSPYASSSVDFTVRSWLRGQRLLSPLKGLSWFVTADVVFLKFEDKGTCLFTVLKTVRPITNEFLGIAPIVASLCPGPPYKPRENIRRFSDVFMSTNRVFATYLPLTTFYVLQFHAPSSQLRRRWFIHRIQCLSFRYFRYLVNWGMTKPMKTKSVCFLLGNSPASEFCMPTFWNTLSVPSSYPSMKMEQAECSETSAYKIQTAWNYPE
jgi:hypothetical protein